MIKRFTASDLMSMKMVAMEVAQLLPKVGVVPVIGEMGAGKTTFITMLCQEWGIQDPVSSPTFSLVNEYLLPSGERLFHFDLYRLENHEEALDMGIEEYFDQEALCLIEWPDRMGDWLPLPAASLAIAEMDNGRVIEVCIPED